MSAERVCSKQGHGVFGPGHHSVTTGPHGGLWMIYDQKGNDIKGKPFTSNSQPKNATIYP